jgi:hypothetical protein
MNTIATFGKGVVRHADGPWGDVPKKEKDPTLARIDEETERQHAEIDRKAELSRQRQTRIDQLQRAVTAAETSLVEFESKKTYLIERKQQLQDQLTILWGKQKGDLSFQINYDPMLGIVESCGTIQAIDAALSDAPRVKKQLVANLDHAKQQLAEFQRNALK